MGKTFKQEPVGKSIIRRFGRSIAPKAFKKFVHHRERRSVAQELRLVNLNEEAI
jgi:hypothetical protein